MDDRYDSYCAVDPLYYDSLTNTKQRGGEYPIAGRPVPQGWESEPVDDWLVCAPVGDDLPAQGWKVHVSARLDNAERVAGVVWDYCVAHGLSFKFLRGPQMVLMRNAKYAARGGSGKFVTVYPHDEAELELVCKELSELLAGEAGPQILSDLRYGAGPVHLRYGGFSARFCLSADGELVPAVADPDGTLVPDERGPVFRVPEWVTVPGFLAPHLAARNAVTTNEVPYRIERVMHFSNGGGLYAAEDTRTGERVVLKEARPHAGLDATGADAVTRLHRERRNLEALAGLAVPRVHDAFRLGEHEFLALGYVDGQPLNRELVARFPLTDPDSTAEARAAFTAWALDVHGQIERTVREIHLRGIVYGDLHLFNVMVGPDGRVTLVDFEVAAPVTEPGRPALRNQGFAAPHDRTGFAVDEYALGCLALALFAPLTSLIRLVPAKARHLADVIAGEYPVPADFLDRAVHAIDGRAIEVPGAVPPAGGFALGDWPAGRDRMAGAILASATPGREDRLFPGDIEQFHSGGLSLGYGAAGVLWALSATGAGRYPAHEQWLADRALRPASGTRVGFFDGLHGVAFALDALGREDEAHEVLGIALDQPWHQLGHDLASGLAGVGLNLAHFAGRHPGAREAAADAVALLAARHDELAARGQSTVDDEPRVSGGTEPFAGLTRGEAGPALLFLRWYELTGDSAMLGRAGAALRLDLSRCLVREDGAMEVNEGWRTMPYLAHGSVGIGAVLDRYLWHRPDDDLRAAAAAIRRAARSPFYAQSGLFAGRAGIIAYLAGRRAWCPDEAVTDTAELNAQLDRLAWHAMPVEGNLAFPGEQLLRLSMDLATGTAGVLLAVAMARHERAPTLPLLDPPPPARVATAPDFPRGENTTDRTIRGEVSDHGSARPSGDAGVGRRA